jgi:hypothetical protein
MAERKVNMGLMITKMPGTRKKPVKVYSVIRAQKN